MNATLAECGRCGAVNSEDAEFCQSCGALLAAYRAPSGATETIPPPQTELVSQSTTLFVPPSRDSLADYESLTTPIAVARSQPENPVEPPQPVVAQLITAPEPETVVQASPAEHREESAWQAAARETQEQVATTTTAATQAPTTYRPTGDPEPRGPQPVPEAYRSTSARTLPNPRTAYQQTRRTMSGNQSSTPQLLIFAGIAAFLLAFLIGVAAGSTIAVVLLFLGGPLGFGLIMAGVLMLIGKHPTGRP